MPELSAEDQKLVTLARAARARAGAVEGAAVRDGDGRTYAGASVALPSLTLTALQYAVASAAAAGATVLEAAGVVTEGSTVDGAGQAAFRDLPADEQVGRGDRFIAGELGGLKARVVAVVTKTDLVSRADLAAQLVAVSELAAFADVVPASAVTGDGLDTLTDVLVSHLPESPRLYPDDMLTDEPEQVLIGELVREAALEGVRDELPHSIAVLVEEMFVEGALTKIYADVYVERQSQKAIVIGARGSRLKEVGTKARQAIEELLGTKVYLDLHVRVAKDWQRDPKQLRKLGF